MNNLDKPVPITIVTITSSPAIVENTEIIELVRLLAKENPDLTSWIILFVILSVIVKEGLGYLREFITSAATLWADKNTKNWEQYQKFNDLVEEAMIQTEASNAYVIRCHNGGGIPQPGVATFSTITNRFGPGSSKNIWDSFPHDGELSRIVTDIRHNQAIITATSDLKDCDFRTALEESGIIYQVSVLLNSSRKRIVYCTFHFKEEFDETKAMERLKTLRLRGHAIAEMVGDRGLSWLWPLRN